MKFKKTNPKSFKKFDKNKKNPRFNGKPKHNGKSKQNGKPKQNGFNEDEEIKLLQSKYESINSTDITSFTDFPLSKKTVKGLKDCNYTKPTAIQKESIGHALQGKDVLGSAITGSGKTLAFLIPVMECLFIQKWSRTDGVGAIVISPTRELAYQIFETLKKIGKLHDFSAGLIIGGKNLKFEKSRMDQCNIIICTPGRLLQHMDENPLFDCSSLQVLVLDEADRCLDLGFEQTMNAIIENLPPKRQTFLYSATQTKSVKDLARLSLTDPMVVAPHEQAAFSTPDALQQNYVVVALEDKITMLWSFLKNHLKQKCIVFLSTCKQVKYVYEIFCKLRPGTSIIALYGTLHQDRRMAIYNEFCRKSNVVLFATDVASRGLDFPVVNWVVQLDCPEDATAYIHRAGRTARHTAHGENLLVLLPSEEEAMVSELIERKIPINKIAIDPKRMFTPRAKMEGFLAQSNELRESAQRAFVAYIKSVVLMQNKKVFDVNALDTDAYSRSLGLAVPPRIRFLSRMKKNRDNNKKNQLANKQNNLDERDESDSESSNAEITSAKPSKDDQFNFNVTSDEDEDDNDTFIQIKRKNHEIREDQLPEVPPLDEEKSKNKKPITKAALAKRVIKKKIMANKKLAFDDDGTEITDTAKQLQSELAKEYEEGDEGGINIEKAKDLLREEDKFDKERFKKMVKARHKESKNAKKTASGDQEQFDNFGSDEDSDGPDMSWLPDPDKVYTKRGVVNSSDESDDSNGPRQVVNSSDESEEDEIIHKPPKKLVAKKNNRKVQQNISDSNEEDAYVEEDEPPQKKTKKMVSKLTENEAEMLAMQLLGGRV